MEGDPKGTLERGGGTQNREKTWQIPKYHIEIRQNTDTIYFNYIYNQSSLLMAASI